MEFAEKVAVVTGAGSGIGRATARLFAEAGAEVLVADIDGAAVQETATIIGEAVGASKVESKRVDVGNATDVKGMIEAAIEAFGRIDILHNNAGTAHDYVPVDEIEEEVWERVIDTNLKGPYLGAKYAVPYMREQEGQSVIVNTASNTAIGKPSSYGLSAYTASKGGLLLLTKQLAYDLKGDDIRAVAICPGATDTHLMRENRTDEEINQVKQRQPFGRLNDPEDVALAVLFLASDKARNITGISLSLQNI